MARTTARRTPCSTLSPAYVATTTSPCWRHSSNTLREVGTPPLSVRRKRRPSYDGVRSTSDRCRASDTGRRDTHGHEDDRACAAAHRSRDVAHVSGDDWSHRACEVAASCGAVRRAWRPLPKPYILQT